MYFSQQQEDYILSQKYLNYRNGTFVELGAMNGVTYSNTLFFEQQLGWSGVLIEPTNQFEELKVNRKNCKNYNVAVSITEGEVEFLGSGAVGGMLHTMPSFHREGNGLNSHVPFRVKTMPISKILKDAEIKKIDFFSIDTEGGELEVLSSFDWKIPVYIMLVEFATDRESDPFVYKKNKKCRDMLVENGFTFDMIIGCNEVWINNNFNK